MPGEPETDRVSDRDRRDGGPSLPDAGPPGRGPAFLQADGCGDGRARAVHPPPRHALVQVQGPHPFRRRAHGPDAQDDCHPPPPDARNQHGGGDGEPDGRSPGTGKGHFRRGQCHHAEPHARGIPRELFHLPGQGVRPRHARPVPVLPGHPVGGHRPQDSV